MTLRANRFAAAWPWILGALLSLGPIVLAAAVAPPDGGRLAPVNILLKGDGQFIVDATNVDAAGLNAAVQARAALQQAAAEQGLAPGLPPPQMPASQVQLQFINPEKIKYEDFLRVVEAAARAGCETIDIGAKSPLRLPRTVARPAAPPDAAAPAESPKLATMAIATAADLRKIDEQKAVLKDLVVKVDGWTDAPMSLVLPALRALVDAGADPRLMAFTKPGGQPESLPAPLVIEQGPPGSVPGVMMLKSVEKSVKKKGETTSSGRGKFKPGNPPTILHDFTDNPFPDVAGNGLSQLEVLGVGGGGGTVGGFEGLGTGGKGFFGLSSTGGAGGGKIVYIVDRSGSMTDSIDYVKMELKRSISDLADDKKFHVIFYSSGPPVENAPRRLVNATERNKAQANEFIDAVVAQGETDPSEAIRRAFAVQPDLIYLLTDGEFDRSIITLCKDFNKDKKVTIHTIGFLYRTGETVLKQIADDGGGNYKFVSEKDLEQLANPDRPAPAPPKPVPPKPAPTVIVPTQPPAPDTRVAKPVTVKIVNPDPIMFQMEGQKENINFDQLTATLVRQAAALGKNEKLQVTLQFDLKTRYAAVALAMLACGKAKVEDIRFNDLAVSLPDFTGPVSGRPAVLVPRLKISLTEVGPKGDYVQDGKNEFCAIQVPDEGKVLGDDFGALQKLLVAKKAGPTPFIILIAPTMNCQWQWVRHAAQAAKAAGYDNLQFAVPYE
jgi:biopolymer transport protein ExbD